MAHCVAQRGQAAFPQHVQRLPLAAWPARVRVAQLNTKGYSSTYLAMGFANVRAGTRSPGLQLNTKGYSSTDLAMGFANVRAGTRYPPEH